MTQDDLDAYVATAFIMPFVVVISFGGIFLFCQIITWLDSGEWPRLLDLLISNPYLPLCQLSRNRQSTLPEATLFSPAGQGSEIALSEDPVDYAPNEGTDRSAEGTADHSANEPAPRLGYPLKPGQFVVGCVI